MRKSLLALLLWGLISNVFTHKVTAQESLLSGIVSSSGKNVPSATVSLNGRHTVITDSNGQFQMHSISPGNYTLLVSCMGYENYTIAVSAKKGKPIQLNIQLNSKLYTLNDVVITGVSKITLIRENPFAVVSVSPKTIEQTTADNVIDDLVKQVPGLNALKTGPNISKPFIRGLGYNRVVTLYDGIKQEGQQWGDEHGIEIDDYNVSKAEIIKGPASIIFGSDALAGVMSIFPYIPMQDDGKWHGRFLSEYQSNNNLVGNGLWTGYSDQHFSFALRGSYRLAKNYRNAIDGRVYNTSFYENNFSALIGYKTKKGSSYLNFTAFSDVQGIPDGSRDSLTRKFTKQIYEGDQDTLAKRPIVSNSELNSYKVPDLHQHPQHFRAYSQHKYAIGNGEIDLLLAYQESVRNEYIHPSAPDVTGLYVRLNSYCYNLRYNLPALSHVETSVGVNGMIQRNKSNQYATDFIIPDYHLWDGGVYAYTKWQKGKWIISGGLRYDICTLQYDDFYVGTDPVTGFNNHAPGPGGIYNGVLQFPAFQKRYGGASGSLGFTYRVNQKLSIKGNLGRGYRVPNINEIGCNGLDPVTYTIYIGDRNASPEFSLQEDIGVIAKTKDITTEISFFNNNIQNFIYQAELTNSSGEALLDNEGHKTYQYMQASAQIYGMEAWLSITPATMKGFRLNNNFALIYGYNRNSIYKSKGINGEYLPWIPPLRLISMVSQKIEIRSKLFKVATPKIEMELNGAQNRFLGLNGTETATPGYVLLNAGLNMEVNYTKTQNLLLQLQVNNLFDKAYQNNLSRLKYFEYYSNSTNGHYGIYDMGRNICVKLVVPF